jgi:hypothetical protein
VYTEGPMAKLSRSRIPGEGRGHVSRYDPQPTVVQGSAWHLTNEGDPEPGRVSGRQRTKRGNRVRAFRLLGLTWRLDHRLAAAEGVVSAACVKDPKGASQEASHRLTHHASAGAAVR